MQSFNSDVFTARLIQLRKEKKLTQLQMAEQLPVSRTGYSSWEQGKSKPDLEDLAKLCVFFNVSADYLLGLCELSHPAKLSVTGEIPQDPFSALDPDLRSKAEGYLDNLFETQKEREAASQQEA